MDNAVELPHPQSIYAQELQSPNVPPTAQNIVNAPEYAIEMGNAVQEHLPLNDEEYAAAVGAAPPPWLGPALQAGLAANPVINGIEERLHRLEQRLAVVTTFTAKHANGLRGGQIANLEIVPFPNGMYPSEIHPPLPPLVNIQTIVHLNSQNCDAYLTQYYPGEALQGTLEDKKKKLLVALGCSMIR